MNFNKLLMYQVVEFDGGIAIIAQRDKLQRPDAVPLCIADGATIAEYLARYIHARESGKSIIDAHKSSLHGAKILQNGPLLDAPGKLS